MTDLSLKIVGLNNAFRLMSLDDWNLRLRYVEEIEARLAKASFSRSQGEHVDVIESEEGQSTFVFARDWLRKPVRIPNMFVSTVLVISTGADPRALFRVQRSDGAFFCVKIMPGDTPIDRRYKIEADYDTRHEGAFPELLLRNELPPGKYELTPDRMERVLTLFLQRL